MVICLLVYNLPITKHIDVSINGVKRNTSDISYQEAVVDRIYDIFD